jgi:membrane-bound lytic murein transglycosylase D
MPEPQRVADNPPTRASQLRGILLPVAVCIAAALTGCAQLGLHVGEDTAATEVTAADVTAVPHGDTAPPLAAVPDPPPVYDQGLLADGLTYPGPVPVEPPADLLDRLRRSFSLEASDDAIVQRELAWYASHPDYLQRVFGRAERYLYHIADMLEARKMPGDLALLPIVESAFDPFAYSHGRAAGLWQIIPGTGRRLGLKQNWWYDGRRDVVESTRAALDYLESLHEMFDGDWLLAIAGYNSGEGNVSRALRRARDAGEPTDFWHIKSYLPAETRTYVPRLLAIAQLVAAPEVHGLTLPLLTNVPYFAAVDTQGQIDMVLAAELAGLSADQLYELNPGFNRWATDPDGPHRLLVPIDREPDFTAALSELGERGRVEWTRHQIRPGETLSQIARRYRTTPEVLRAANALSGNLIRAGQHLMVPHAVGDLAAYTQSADQRTARRQAQRHGGQRHAHIVQAGETLWSISRQYRVSTRELASWNAMAPGDVLSVGRELVVWTDSPVTAQTASERIRQLTYTVRRGDSLARISSRFRVSVAELLRWNSLSADKYLQPGQRLTLYVDVTNQSS